MADIGSIEVHPNVILSSGSIDVLSSNDLASFARGAAKILPKGGRVVHFLDILPGDGTYDVHSQGLESDMKAKMNQHGLRTQFMVPECELAMIDDVDDFVARSTINLMTQDILFKCLDILEEIGHPGIDFDHIHSMFLRYNVPILLADRMGKELLNRITSVDEQGGKSVKVGPSEYASLLGGLTEVTSQGEIYLDGIMVNLVSAAFAHILDSANIEHYMSQNGFELVREEMRPGKKINTRRADVSWINYGGAQIGMEPRKVKRAEAVSFVKALEFVKI